MALLLFTSVITACKKDEVIDPDLAVPTPTIDHVELGLGDAGIGVIGQDFHFNADILAADKLEKVEVRMVQKNGETYSKPWEHVIVWAEYKNLKNANVHKHFTIPKDAAEGKYNFIITIYDQDGSKLEVITDFAIYKQENIPVTPMFTQLNLVKNWQPIYDTHGMSEDPVEKFLKGDTLTSQASISFVKDDGLLYMLLIKKSANHNPKTIEEIDFNKAIVYDMFEHKNEKTSFTFGNFLADFTTDPFTFIKDIPEMRIGAATDNKLPIPNPISGSKAWETGAYNLVIIYKNTTHNKTIHKTVPFNIVY